MRFICLCLLICLYPFSTKANTYARDVIAYMNNLQTCTPHIFKYTHPKDKENKGTNIIYGKKGKACQVKYFLPNNVIMKCAHSPTFIKLATSNKKYVEAMSKDFKEASNKKESTEESKLMAKECTVYYNGKKLNFEKGGFTVPKKVKGK